MVSHFIPVKSTNASIKLALVFIRDIVRFHLVFKKIVSDRDVNFTARFWKELFTHFGTKLVFSTTYHP